MTILHVTDFHFHRPWFEWLRHDAPAHDLVVMSGDLLDLSIATPQPRQIAWVSDWLNDFPRPICVCSGNHDLEWDSETDRWMPAYWLRGIVNPLVWTDGQRIALNGISVLNLGATTHPKGGDAEVWVVHAAPSRTLVATRSDGADGGDPDLVATARHFTPRLVLSGHVHDPLSWREHRDGTLFLNPGRNPNAPFPNHILVRTDSLECERIVAPHRAESSVASPPEHAGAPATA
ncbi:MAG TPA: metallophosphoesterase family protein [Lacunisphaera sp.]|nr:metallophosphoesterase family protein [Lacunisphaera sp.]